MSLSKLSKSVTPAKAVVQKGSKMLDSAVLHYALGFRRNDNNVLLKLAHNNKMEDEMKFYKIFIFVFLAMSPIS